MKQLTRNDDGVKHLNIWSKGRTELGQAASNFALTPFTHPEYGGFASIEALWYWLATGMQHNELRRLYGVSAKTAGKRLPRVEMDSEKFQSIIKEAIRLKFEQTPGLKKLLIDSLLPFEHYFVYGHDNDVIRDQRPRHGWQTDYLEHLRDTWRMEAGLAPLNHVLVRTIVDGKEGPEENENEAETDYQKRVKRNIFSHDVGRGIINPILYGLDENGEIIEHKAYVKDTLAKLAHDDIQINGFDD